MHDPDDRGHDETYDWVAATIAAVDEEDSPSQAAAAGTDRRPLIANRYRDIGPLGIGGMGEVRRVWDMRLMRTTAMKVIRPGRHEDHVAVERFVREAHTTGRLQHPGVVPVHDMGRLDDGRLWFTMKEVEGETYQQALSRLHGSASPDAWPSGRGVMGFRRMADALLRACQTMAYAHDAGFVHRDLKPENLMLGRFGEVMVLDWGLGKLIGAPSLGRSADPSAEQSDRALRASTTIAGGVVGSPPFMSPEQARGELESLGPTTDVYSLGAVLYHLLCGRMPYKGRSAMDIVAQVRAGPPRSVVEAARHRCPEPEAELVGICERAMQREATLRFPNAGELAAALESWLDGTRRLEEARAIVDSARDMALHLAARSSRTLTLTHQGDALLDDVPPDAPEQARHAGWAKQEEAEALQRQIERAEAEYEVTLQSAIKLASSVPEAHERLADLYKERLISAEQSRDLRGVAQNEALLRAHDRGRHTAWLRADGRVSLDTEPPGATVTAFRMVQRHRRLVPEEIGVLGVTPLVDAEVPRGSLLLEVRAPGREPALLPLLLGRGEHLDHVPPGASKPVTIPLFETGQLGPDDVYVPAGWTIIGGDGVALDAWPRRRVWIDGFVVTRCHITVGQYREFVLDLVAQGRRREADGMMPGLGLDSAPLWDVGDDGQIVLTGQQNHNRPFDDDDLPISMVNHAQAAAYAAWRAQRDELPWRLPHDLEWEKAARGADGRAYPWGDAYVRGRASTEDSHDGTPRVVNVGQFPADRSVYGMCDVAGLVRTWCANRYLRQPPFISGSRPALFPADDPNPTPFIMVRGGNLASAPRLARLASRYAGQAGNIWSGVGFRMVRPLAG